MKKIACIILAAGKSSRMGRNKLLIELENQTLLERTIETVKSSTVEKLLGISGNDRAEIEDLFQKSDIAFIHNEDFEVGMHSSIKCGVEQLVDYDGVIICLGDQPFLNETVLNQLHECFEKNSDIIVPTYNGKRGNPVLIGRDYFSEIQNEPDGDYGCAYLLKRHQKQIKMIEVGDDGIHMDMDSPKHLKKVLERIESFEDPFATYTKCLQEIRQRGEPFVLATVIEVIGSSSAKVGSRAIFDKSGKNFYGWIGGGCAERFVGEESVTSLNERKGRIILADLEDEVFGLGVDCGGKMRIFLDPVFPLENISLSVPINYRRTVQSLASFYGWNVNFSEAKDSSFEDVILQMACGIAKNRGAKGEPLRIVKPVPATFSEEKFSRSSRVKIIGRTRITEALARHFSLFNMDVNVFGTNIEENDYPSEVTCVKVKDSYQSIDFEANDIVLVASHTSGDSRIVAKALRAGANYVGMIGSLKRSHEVLTYLEKIDQRVSEPLFIPAGLDIDAQNPDEIALSVLAEYLYFTSK